MFALVRIPRQINSSSPAKAGADEALPLADGAMDCFTCQQ
jgi:hypothetical protein